MPSKALADLAAVTAPTSEQTQTETLSKKDKPPTQTAAQTSTSTTKAQTTSREEKLKALKAVEATLNKQFGVTTSLVRLGDRVGKLMPSLSGNLYTLDYGVIGTGGLPRGRIIEVYGPESGGKTTLCLNYVAEEQKRGEFVAYVDAEHSLDPNYMRQLGVDVDELIVSQPDCYDALTEVLTEDGWVRFSVYDIRRKVAQVLPTGVCEFVYPVKKTSSIYSGEMVKFVDGKGCYVDLLVTPNHRMIYQKHSNVFGVETANLSSFYHKKDIPVSAATAVQGPGLSPDEKLLIAFQADGALPSGSRYEEDNSNMGSQCGYISIRFNFKKDRKKEEIRALLPLTGFEWSESVESSRPENSSFYVKVPRDWVQKKTLSWANPVTRSLTWCREFIGEVSKWDSTVPTETYIRYTTCVPDNANVVQLAAVLSGYKVTYTVQKDERKGHFRDNHCVHIHPYSSSVGGQNIIKSTVSYAGPIYCVTVPSGMIVVRRNGKVAVCGNSGEQALETVEALIESHTVRLIIVDSVAALVPQAELDGEMGDSHMGLQARMMSQAMRKLRGKCAINDVTVVFINQIREKIGVMFGSPETTTGGRALKFYASVRLDVRRTGGAEGLIKSGDVILGHKMKIKGVKNKVGTPARETIVDVIYGKGIDTFADFVTYAKEVGAIQQSGSWFNFGDDRLGQGLTNTINNLRDNPDLMEKIKSEVAKAQAAQREADAQ